MKDKFRDKIFILALSPVRAETPTYSHILFLANFILLQWNLYKADTIGAKKVSAL